MKTLTLDMIESIEIDVENGFAWAEDKDGNNILQVCLDDNGDLDCDDLGHDWGVCGHCNDSMGYTTQESLDDAAKVFAEAYKKMIVDEYEKTTLKKMDSEKFAVIQLGHCIYGSGETLSKAVEDANENLETKIEIKDGEYHYCGDVLELDESLVEDGDLCLVSDKITIRKYQLSVIGK